MSGITGEMFKRGGAGYVGREMASGEFKDIYYTN
jgi:hypothetical protein